MSEPEPTQRKGTFDFIIGDDEYELEGHASIIIVEDNGSIFPHNLDLIRCTVCSTCNAAIQGLRPGTSVICNRKELNLMDVVNGKRIAYIAHTKIIGKVSKKIKGTESKLILAETKPISKCDINMY